MSEPPAEAPVFAERLTRWFAPEVYTTSLPLIAFAGVFLALQWWIAATLALVLGLFAAFFFRNPPREIPGDARTVVAPADGRVVEAGEIQTETGIKALRIGVFLSIFDVHVNRAPLAGRVLAKERGGERYLTAFNKAAEREGCPRHNHPHEAQPSTGEPTRKGPSDLGGGLGRQCCIQCRD